MIATARSGIKPNSRSQPSLHTGDIKIVSIVPAADPNHQYQPGEITLTLNVGGHEITLRRLKLWLATDPAEVRAAAAHLWCVLPPVSAEEWYKMLCDAIDRGAGQ